jgi:hypothetical protein
MRWSIKTNPIDYALSLGALRLSRFLRSLFGRTGRRNICLDPCEIAWPEIMGRENRASMIRSRPFQLYQATLAGKR